MTPPTALTLSRYKLTTFLACQRRFELRYQKQLAWPTQPLPPQTEQRQWRGERFHQLLERHFLGLPIYGQTIADEVLRGWWRAFQQSNVQPNNGRFLPELDLTVPLGAHQLNGRFDLLVLNQEKAAIFDWKTGKPQTITHLQHNWQTRLYLAMLAESGTALGQPISPDQISLTYWYVHEPNAPRTIHYSQVQHQQNWADLLTLTAQIEAQRQQNEPWPLTDDWHHCQQCAYQTYCGRQEAGVTPTLAAEAEEPATETISLEPAIP